LQVNKQTELTKKKEDSLGSKSVKDKQKKEDKVKKKKVCFYISCFMYVQVLW